MMVIARNVMTKQSRLPRACALAMTAYPKDERKYSSIKWEAECISGQNPYEN